MKLSKKGQQKVLDNFGNFIHIRHVEFDVDDFESDDFQGVVCLAVEEAKEIYWLLEGHRKDYAKIDWENDRDARLVLIKKQGALNEKWREVLPKRIEQAEGKCSSE